MNDPLEHPPEDGPSALQRFLAREMRKLENGAALWRAALQRRAGASAAAIPDPAQPEFEGLVPRPTANLEEWIAARLEFLRFVEGGLARADRRAMSFFWLGAACSFLEAAPYGEEGLEDLLRRLGGAARHYSDLARVTDGEADRSRQRDEPWDASFGCVPRRRLRGAAILREAAELLREQQLAWEYLLGEAERERR